MLRWTGRLLAAAWLLLAASTAAAPGPDLPRRGRRRPTGEPGGDPVSVVVPMRDEAANAGRCVAALLAQDHVPLEVVVVDDESRDGTAALARAAADGDPRLTVVSGAPVPDGWVGKPWACAQGAAVATGDWLVFLDADVTLAPGALTELLADVAEHDAVVTSWVGLQVHASFWERVIQPAVLLSIASLTPLPLARHPSSRVVAVNGQLLGFRRDAYDFIGGHEAVQDAVVEDLALGRLAKAAFGRGYRFVWARDLMSTRMYTSLPEIAEGWTKNVALGSAAVGIHPGLAVAGALVVGTGPWVGAAAWAAGAGGAAPFAIAAAAQVAAVGTFGWRCSRQSPAWGLLAWLGSAALVAITGRSWARTARGSVTWRGREYRARR